MGVREPLVIRPPVIGAFVDTTILASKSCPLDIIGADYSRDIDPRETVIIFENGIKSKRIAEPQPSHICIFEYIYFARPDSRLEGQSVYQARKSIGQEL